MHEGHHRKIIGLLCVEISWRVERTHGHVNLNTYSHILTLTLHTLSLTHGLSNSLSLSVSLSPSLPFSLSLSLTNSLTYMCTHTKSQLCMTLGARALFTVLLNTTVNTTKATTSTNHCLSFPQKGSFNQNEVCNWSSTIRHIGYEQVL